jgi:two-component system, sensor histidine kinase and response regulator
MKSILVIEDEPQIRNNLQEILTLSDFETMTAPNGLIGWQLLQEVRPDLILCDVNMPELDGYDFLKMLRQDDSTANIPFVFLTSNGQRPDVRSGMESGASDYLTKPINRQELLRTIHTQLKKQTAIERRTEFKLNHLRSNINLALPHELHTPLNGIIVSADLLKQEDIYLDSSERLELVEQIHDSALRLHHLIRNFLIYANLEVSVNSPDRQDIIRQNRRAHISPIAPVKHVSAQIAKAYHRQDDLSLSLQDHPIPISELKLKKIVEELVDNAFKFSAKGQSVRLVGVVDADCYHLSVIDIGRGMTSEQIDNIGAYMQFDRSRYEQQGGGLGLGIVQRMADLHGGELLMYSLPEQETIARVVVPLKWM